MSTYMSVDYVLCYIYYIVLVEGEVLSKIDCPAPQEEAAGCILALISGVNVLVYYISMQLIYSKQVKG